MKQLKLSVSPRTETGRGPMKRLRAAGSIPAVVYGQSGVKPLSVKSDDFRKLMRSTGGSAALIEIENGKNTTLTIIQDTQRDPCTDKFLHIDFHEVRQDQAMHTTLPVHIQGDSIGVKENGGVLELFLHNIGIRCLPKDLPECINVDVSDLKVGMSLHVKDLPAHPGVTYLVDEDVTVVACIAPKLSEESAEESPEAAEGETPAESKES